jgi:hypothetical protein
MRLWILLFYIGGEIVVAALNFALCFFEEAFRRWQVAGKCMLSFRCSSGRMLRIHGREDHPSSAGR